MIPIRLGIFAFIIALCVSCSKPIAVTHWTAKDRASVNKGRTSFGGKKPFGYPNHKWYSKVICFDDKCRNKAAWVKKQREHRFKGFKDGGKLPTPPPRNTRPSDTTTMIAAGQPKKTTTKNNTKSTAKSTQVTQQTAAPVITQPVQTVAPKRDSLIVLNEFLFAVNSFKLKPELYPELDSLVDFMKTNPSTKIEISGHTDATGNEPHNLRLSENRADAVAEYIVDKGIETGRVSFNGYGSSRPIAPNNTEQGRKKNRRVEILIHDRK